jgi:hypothetical protein
MYVRASVNGTIEQAHAAVTVEPPDLSLSADRTEIQEGDTVVFTGQIIPESAPYEVVGWSWQPDGIITAAVSPMRRNMTTVLTDSTVTGDSVEADSIETIDDSDTEVPDNRPATYACTDTELECTMSIYSSGTVTLTAYVAGTLRTRSVHVNVKYECPPQIPIDAVFGPGEFPIAARETWAYVDGARISLGPQTVYVSPPFTLAAPGNPNKDGLAVGWYKPASGTGPAGYLLFPALSSVRFVCRTYTKWNGSELRYKWHGSVEYDNRSFLWFYPPRTGE